MGGGVPCWVRWSIEHSSGYKHTYRREGIFRASNNANKQSLNQDAVFPSVAKWVAVIMRLTVLGRLVVQVHNSSRPTHLRARTQMLQVPQYELLLHAVAGPEP